VTTDRARLEPGELFEWHAVAGGVRIELLAEVEVSGATLHLRDVAVFPVGVEHADVGLRPLLRAARSELFPVLRAAGFSRLRVTGTRLSGASPGRIVDLTIDLERQAR
jgi:hypothetical protein